MCTIDGTTRRRTLQCETFIRGDHLHCTGDAALPASSKYRCRLAQLSQALRIGVDRPSRSTQSILAPETQVGERVNNLASLLPASNGAVAGAGGGGPALWLDFAVGALATRASVLHPHRTVHVTTQATAVGRSSRSRAVHVGRAKKLTTVMVPTAPWDSSIGRAAEYGSGEQGLSAARRRVSLHVHC